MFLLMFIKEVLVPLGCNYAKRSTLVQLEVVRQGAYMCSLGELEDGLKANALFACVSFTRFFRALARPT